MASIVYNLHINDADELLSKLRTWIDEGLIKGQLSGQSFSIKEIDRDVVKGINESDDGKLVSIIEGVIENGIIKLTAVATTPLVTLRRVGRFVTFLIFLAIVIETHNMLYFALAVVASALIVTIGNSLERRRIKNDLDVFVWMVNTRCNVKLMHNN